MVNWFQGEKPAECPATTPTTTTSTTSTTISTESPTTKQYIEKAMFKQLTELWVDREDKDALSQQIGADDTVKVFYT